jgi:hypothetical protein
MQELLRKDSTWKWGAEQQPSFETTKVKLLNSPVLALPNPTQKFCVYTDASLLGCGCILMQDERAVAFCGRKFTRAELNYSTTEQELAALVYALTQRRCYLEGVDFVLYTDHHHLVWLAAQAKLSRRQARWVGFLQRFPMTLKHVPGSKNPADPISRASHLSIDVSADSSPEGGSSNSTHNLMVVATKAQTPKHHRSERIKNLKQKRRAEEAIQQERAAAASANRPLSVSDDIWQLRSSMLHKDTCSHPDDKNPTDPQKHSVDIQTSVEI